MKPAMVLLLLMVLATSYLIGVAIRKRNKRRQALLWDAAKYEARWEVFADAENTETVVGVQRVARLGKRLEVIDQEVTKRVSRELSLDDREFEVRIGKADAAAYADLLND